MNYIKLEELTISELEIGIVKVLENAENMIFEADLLYKKGRYPRAYTLSQLAIEEIGKSRLLFSLIMDLKLGNEINYKEANRDFIHHQTKSKSAIVFETIVLLVMHSNGKGSPDQRKTKFLNALEELQKESESIDDLNNKKNGSLYVGIVDKKFITPEDVISREMVDGLRTNALIRLEASRTILKAMLEDIDKITELMKEAESKEENMVNNKFIDSFFK